MDDEEKFSSPFDSLLQLAVTISSSVHVDVVEENVDNMDMGLLNVGDGWELAAVSSSVHFDVVKRDADIVDMGTLTVVGGWEWATVPMMSSPSLNTMMSLSSLNTMISSSLISSISYSVSSRGVDVSDVSSSSLSSSSMSIISSSSSVKDSDGLDRPLDVVSDGFNKSSSAEINGGSLRSLAAPSE